MLPDPESLPLLPPAFESRGDPMKAVKVKASIKKQENQSDETLYHIYTNHKELFMKGQQCINAKNVSWEIQKAMAIQMMTAAMTELDIGIVEASKFAAAVTGFSCEVASCVLQHSTSISRFT